MAIIVDEFGNITNTDPRVVSEEQGLAGYTPGMGPMDPNDLLSQLPLNSLRGLDSLRFKDLGGRDDEDDERDYLTAKVFSELSSSTEDTGIRKLLQYLPFGEKSLLRRGFEGISSLIPKNDPRAMAMQNFYGRRFGLTPTGSVASGIMAGYNPVSGFGENKKFGLGEAIADRIAKRSTIGQERINKRFGKDSERAKQFAAKTQELINLGKEEKGSKPTKTSTPKSSSTIEDAKRAFRS